MKTFKVFKHTTDQPTEITELEMQTTHDVADAMVGKMRKEMTRQYPDIPEKEIEVDLSALHAAGHATTFTIFAGAYDVENEKYHQKTAHFTVVRITN